MDKPVILCVDDDQDFLDSMKTIIESNNYIVKTANSAEDGVRCYKAERPDLVIVDLMMEEVDSTSSIEIALRIPSLKVKRPRRVIKFFD